MGEKGKKKKKKGTVGWQEAWDYRGKKRIRKRLRASESAPPPAPAHHPFCRRPWRVRNGKGSLSAEVSRGCLAATARFILYILFYCVEEGRLKSAFATWRSVLDCWEKSCCGVRTSCSVQLVCLFCLFIFLFFFFLVDTIGSPPFATLTQLLFSLVRN